MKKSRIKWSLIIFLFVLALGIGYAIFSSTISINGITNVESNIWNIHWDNVRYTTSSGVTCTTPPKVDPNSNTGLIYDCQFNEPGDYIEILVDVVNDGTVDAMLNNGVVRINGDVQEELPANIDFYFTYAEGTEVELHHMYPAESKETYRMKVSYTADSASKLPNSDQSTSFQFGLEYVQADSNAVPFYIDKYVDVSTLPENVTFKLGKQIPDVVTYNSFEDILESTQSEFSLRHITQGSKIKQTMIYFIFDVMPFAPHILYGVSPGETDQQTGVNPSYQHNKELLDRWTQGYGSHRWNCEEVETDKSYYYCSDALEPNDRTIEVAIRTDGYLAVRKLNKKCVIEEDGTSYCVTSNNLGI